MPPSSIEAAWQSDKGVGDGLRGGTGWVARGAADPILRKTKRTEPTMWDEIADMPGEIFDIADETRDEMEEAWEAWDDDAALEEFSLECAFGPEE